MLLQQAISFSDGTKFSGGSAALAVALQAAVDESSTLHYSDDVIQCNAV